MYKTYIIIFSFLLTLLGCNQTHRKKAYIKTEFNSLTPKEKIWAHRVNSLDNIEERVENFKGIEVDIYYNKTDNNFMVKHDIDSAGIYLEYFLDSVLNVKEALFWFDYKNLNEETKSGVSTLYFILSERGLEKASFIESYYGSCLAEVEGKLLTSFWVTSTIIPERKANRDSLYEEKYKNIQNLNVSMLSASYEMYDFLTEYFPNHKCNYWMSGTLTKEKIFKLKKMALSTNVNTILIDGNKNLLK